MLDGKDDDVPEQNLYMKGNIDMIKELFSICDFRISIYAAGSRFTMVLRVATSIAVISFASCNRGCTRSAGRSFASIIISSQKQLSSASSSTTLVLWMKSGRDFALQSAR